jgi:hypothetical protein
MAQSPRLVLHEEFTSSTCGPCVGANPTFHTWLTQHPDIYTVLFYHVNWPSPGNDPMYQHNPIDNGARVSYYGVNYVPQGVVDGNYWQGNGSNLQWSTIQNRSAMPSSFSMLLHHQLNAAEDSVFLTMVGTASQAFQGVTVAHNVVIEKHIHFNTAPGTNGEKDFYNVMKKMLPTKDGTPIPNSYAAGDYFLIETAWKLANVYDKAQIAAIGFIQSSLNKEVIQAVNSSSSPLVLPYNRDLQVLEISNISPKNCSGKVTPVVKIRNNGNNTITGFKVNYKVNNEPESSFTWSGSIASLQKAVITLPEYTFTPGANNTLKVYSLDPNNQPDEYPKNDTLNLAFLDADLTSNTIYIFLKTDTKPEETSWEVTNSAGQVIKSRSNYTVPNTTKKDTVNLPAYDCYTFTIYDSGNNGLCCAFGNGGYEIDDKEGGVLKMGGSFRSSELIEFNYDDPQGVKVEKQQQKLTIFPNPAKDNAKLSYTLSTEANVTISIYNTIGQCVYTSDLGHKSSGKNETTVNLGAFKSGLYFVHLQAGQENRTEKLTINR